jgi:hypothetical protein
MVLEQKFFDYEQLSKKDSRSGELWAATPQQSVQSGDKFNSKFDKSLPLFKLFPLLFVCILHASDCIV